MRMKGTEGIGAGGSAGATPLKGVGALLASSFTARGLGLLKLLLFAPLLGPAAFGAFRLASTGASILFSIAALGLHTSYLRYLPELASAGERRRYMVRSLAISLACTTIAALALYPLLPQISTFIFSESTDPLLAMLLLVSLPTMLLYQSGTGMARGLGLFGVSAVGEVLQNVLHIALGLAAISLMGASASAVFVASLAGLLIAGIIMLVGSFRAVGGVDAGAALPAGFGGRVLRFSAWYALIPVFQYFFDFIDRWALARFHGLEMAGAYSLVPIFTGGMIILGASMAPVVARRCAIGRKIGGAAVYTEVWSAISIVTVGSLAYALAIRLGEPLIWMVASGKWASASSTVPWLLLYFSWFNAYYVLGVIATVEESTWVHLASLALGGGMNTALNLLLVPQHGMLGAAFSTAVSILATVAAHLVFVRSRSIKVPAIFWVSLTLPLLVLLPAGLLLCAAVIVGVMIPTTNLVIDAAGKASLVAYLRSLAPRMVAP
jgi:O-antigen/teichoic acid export membrane protein